MSRSGQERRSVVQAQEEAEEAHAFERQSDEDSIILSHDRADLSNRPLVFVSIMLATLMVAMEATIVATDMARTILSWTSRSR